MNFFSKKIAMFSLFAFGATFLMSFDQKSDDFGDSVKVYSYEQNFSGNPDQSITGLVRAAVGLSRMAVRAATHYTPELEQMSYYIFGVQKNEVNSSELKNQKLFNLDN